MQKFKNMGISTLFSIALVSLSSSIALAEGFVNNIFVDGPNNSVIVQTTSPSIPKVKTFSGSFPRVVIDIDNTKLDNSIKNNPNISKEVTSSFPAVKKFMYSEYGSGITTVRIVFNADENFLNQFKVNTTGNNQIAIKLPGGSSTTTNYSTQTKSSTTSFTEPAYQTATNNNQIRQLQEELANKDRKINDLMADIRFLKTTGTCFYR